MKVRTLSDRDTGTQITTLPGIVHPPAFMGNRNEGFYHG